MVLSMRPYPANAAPGGVGWPSWPNIRSGLQVRTWLVMGGPATRSMSGRCVAIRLRPTFSQRVTPLVGALPQGQAGLHDFTSRHPSLRPRDRAALYDICVRTGHEGGDARHLYPEAPALLPDIFAGPYAELEPELAFVADDGGGRWGMSWGRRTRPCS